MKSLHHLIMLSLLSTLSLSAEAGGSAAAGETIASEKCQACHGADGNADNSQYPRLAGQHASYIERALLDYQSGDRKNPIMSGFAAGLSKQDIKDVAAWFAAQNGLTSPVEPNTVKR